MTRRFWLLGSADDLTSVAGSLSAHLGAVFEEHDSWYLGGLYLRGSAPQCEAITIQRNVADEDGCLLEPEHDAYPTLVYVTQSVDAYPLPPGLDGSGIQVLRRDEH